MFLQKYSDFVEDYDSSINRILTVILLIIALASLYVSYVRFGNYESIFKYCLAVYTVVILIYGWSFTGKNHQSLQFLFKNDIPEFILRVLFFSIIVITSVFANSIAFALVFLMIIGLKYSLVVGGDSFRDLWRDGKKILFFVRIIAFVCWFNILLFV